MIADVTAISLPAQLQRSHGTAAVSFALINGRTRLRRLHQQGSAKAIMPHVGAVPETVFLNTSGGLAGGDQLIYRLDLGPGCRAVATTQTAERAYQAGGVTARVQVDMTVGAGGHLDWLPQETILFQGADVDRRTTIDLGTGASCLALEAVVLGRHAMHEVVSRLRFCDRRAITRVGRPVMVEPLVLSDGALTAGGVVLADCRAFASLVLVADDAAGLLTPLRAVLDEPGVDAAASAFDGKLTLRMMARDGWPLRRQIARALMVLRGCALPRVWQM